MNILVVDDEPFIRKGICRAIKDGNRYNNCILEAPNGKVAFDIISKNEIDLVITDIKMPLMDGLELAKLICDEYKEIEVAILTGYDEFEYAKKAIKYKVSEFFLKPVGVKELCSFIFEVKERINRKKLNNSNVMDEYIEDLKKAFLVKLLKGNYNGEKAISNSLKNLGFKGIKYSYILAIEIMKNKITEFEKSFEYIVSPIDNVYAYLFLIDENSLNFQNAIYKEIANSLDNKFILMRQRKSFKDIHIEYKTIIKSINIFFYEENLKCLFLDEIPKCEVLSIEEIDFYQKRLIESFKKRKKNEISDVIDEFEYSCKKQNVSKSSYYKFYQFIIHKIASDINIPELKQSLLGAYRGIRIKETSRELKIYIKNTIFNVIDKVDEYKKYSPNIQIAIRYIKENYQNEVYVTDLSRILMISPNYISKIFKEETKDTFKNYLNRYRIEQSKILLEEKDLKIYEIGEMVGYRDYKYFVSSFKRYVAMTPREYRKNIFNRFDI